MFTLNGINENLHFFILEINKQLELTQKALEQPSGYYLERITSSGDYADNLKNIITKKSYSHILEAESKDERTINSMMALNTISSNLEKIGDYCENIIQQTGYLKSDAFMSNFRYHKYFSVIIPALNKIPDGLFKRDTHLAIEICKSEFQIDELYKKDFKLIMKKIKNNKDDHGDLITALFIFRYLERVGDALLNAGEAIISSVTGTRLKIHQYTSIKESLDNEQDDFEFDQETFSVETRSGCRIEKVKSRTDTESYHEIIFKDGKLKKLQEEKENLEIWEKAIPGLTPRVFEFDSRGENASLLMEYLNGKNFQEIILGTNRKLTLKTLDAILDTSHHVWNKTRKDEPANAGFTVQLKDRLKDVYAVHPYFKEPTQYIGPLEFLPFESMLKAVSTI
jgi:phosphate uptake regulator